MSDKKETGSWKLDYEVRVKDNEAGPALTAEMKTNPGKIRVAMGGGIPGMDQKQLAFINVLLRNKVDEINDTFAGQPGSHISSLRLIAAYCNELADSISIGVAVEDSEE